MPAAADVPWIWIKKMICQCFDPSVVYSQELPLSRPFNPHEKPVQPKPHGTEKSANELNSPPGHSSYKAI